VAITITNITTAAIRSLRWTVDVVCVISTVTVVEAAPLVITPEVTVTVAER
jgi:hypothetical protein